MTRTPVSPNGSYTSSLKKHTSDSDKKKFLLILALGV
jgi:hypothetical protein